MLACHGSGALWWMWAFIRSELGFREGVKQKSMKQPPQMCTNVWQVKYDQKPLLICDLSERFKPLLICKPPSSWPHIHKLLPSTELSWHNYLINIINIAERGWKRTDRTLKMVQKTKLKNPLDWILKTENSPLDWKRKIENSPLDCGEERYRSRVGWRVSVLTTTMTLAMRRWITIAMKMMAIMMRRGNTKTWWKCRWWSSWTGATTSTSGSSGTSRTLAALAFS